jgi:hypothetical protein
MKKAVLIVLAFVVISIGLTWFWNEWARVSYGHFLKAVGPSIYELIGFGDARLFAFRERYINFVPFISLVLVTPGLSLRRRTIGLALGLFFIFASHLALNLTELFDPSRPALPVVSSIVSDTMPFLVWIVIAYPVLAKFLVAAAAPAPEHDGNGEDA